MTQRGCPYSCSFCIESVYQDKCGKKDSLRRRSVDVVIEELVQAKRQLGITAVMFYDDVFTVNPKWLREFAPRYKAEVGPAVLVLHLPDARPAERTTAAAQGCRPALDHHRASSRAARRCCASSTGRSTSELAIEAAQIIVDCGIDGFFDLITRSSSRPRSTAARPSSSCSTSRAR